MRRRTEFERVDEESESRFGFVVRHPEQREDEPLQPLIVNPDAAPTDFAAVQHEIVRAGAHAAGIGFEACGVGFERRRERVVHEFPAVLILQPLEHRKVDDPQEFVALRVEEVLALRDVQAQLPEHL